MVCWRNSDAVWCITDAIRCYVESNECCADAIWCHCNPALPPQSWHYSSTVLMLVGTILILCQHNTDVLFMQYWCYAETKPMLTDAMTPQYWCFSMLLWYCIAQYWFWCNTDAISRQFWHHIGKRMMLCQCNTDTTLGIMKMHYWHYKYGELAFCICNADAIGVLTVSL